MSVFGWQRVSKFVVENGSNNKYDNNNNGYFNWQEHLSSKAAQKQPSFSGLSDIDITPMIFTQPITIEIV